MIEQANRLDPFELSPPSILDRKQELAYKSKHAIWPIVSEPGVIAAALRGRQSWRHAGGRAPGVKRKP
jgi:hypothetical protein